MPRAFPSLCRISVTALPVFIFTPCFFNLASKSSTMLFDESVTGKTLPLSSTFSLSPPDVKKSIISLLSKLAMLLYRNFEFTGIFARSSSLSSAFVRLHLPPPVRRSFLPIESFFSTKRVLAPRLAAETAAIMPDAPAPITITSKPLTLLISVISSPNSIFPLTLLFF